MDELFLFRNELYFYNRPFRGCCCCCGDGESHVTPKPKPTPVPPSPEPEKKCKCGSGCEPNDICYYCSND